MRNTLLSLSILSLSLALTACGKSSSSSDETTPVTTATPTAGGSDAAGTNATTGSTAATDSTSSAGTTSESGESSTTPVASGEVQDAIKLNSTSLEYSRLQYDCGDIAAPLDQATVEAQLKGAKTFETLGATIPAKDQALVKITTTAENGVSCTYRARFSVNKSFTQVTFLESQSLDAQSATACGITKAQIDQGFGTDPINFDYDKKFIRWVALHIPANLQSSPVCASGSLRAVFAGATI